MAVTDIKTTQEFYKLIEDVPYVAIQAHATWCGPCKAIAPFFDKHAAALADPKTYAFARFDTDEVPDLAQELGIRSIPAFFFFEDGNKADNLGGANPPALKKVVEEYREKAKAKAAETKE
ncbi:Fc.00g001190.m01.CDS01 [Cosmosporella sp. VM-42]